MGARNMGRAFGFSLLELMVVVAIISLLTAVAVPAYRDYATRAAFANTIQLMSSMINDGVYSYERTGAFPTTINFAGVVINSGWTSVNTDNIQSLYIAAAVDGKGFSVNVNLYGTPFSSISGVVEGTPPFPGVYTVLQMAVRDVNGTLKFACGQWPYSTQDVPLSELPTGCQCASIYNFYQYGTAC